MMLPTSESGQGLCIPAHSIGTREEVRWAGLFLKSERLRKDFQPLTFFQMLSCHDSDTVSGDLSAQFCTQATFVHTASSTHFWCLCCSRVMARRFGDRTSTLHQAHGSVFTMCEVADAEPSSLAAWAGSSVMRNQAQDAKKQLFQGLAL